VTNAVSSTLRRVIDENRKGHPAALPSVCSAHRDVLLACALRAAHTEQSILIEATSNQVNQFGGYTGMTPEAFVAFVARIVEEAGLDAGQVILGGDHLGPQVWRSGPAEEAMANADQMVADYVRAGFTKIHLDCSEGCAGEPAQVDDETAADRAARLAVTCLDAAPDPDALLFVVGTEVPPPGGARMDEDGDIPATTAEAIETTLRTHREVFSRHGIGAAWAQVAGLVVQPGVEFTPMHVHHLPPDRGAGFKQALTDWPGLCYEAHSTDYQRPPAYRQLAQMGFAIHKVGPALTFAWREAVYALDTLRRLAGYGSGDLPATMEEIMLAQPDHWQSHYHGDDPARRVMRHFGLADRIRYYWPHPDAVAAVDRLFADLRGTDLPRPLLSQVFASRTIARAEDLRAHFGADRARALVAAHVQIALDPYYDLKAV